MLNEAKRVPGPRRDALALSVSFNLRFAMELWSSADTGTVKRSLVLSPACCKRRRTYDRYFDHRQEILRALSISCRRQHVGRKRGTGKEKTRLMLIPNT